MSDDRYRAAPDGDIDDRRAEPRKSGRGAPLAPDERGGIEWLECALAEEREKSATLLGSVEALQFKLEVLERSYAKQLDDARQRCNTAEGELAERRSLLEDAQRSLTETRDELARVAADRDRLRRQLAADDGPDSVPEADAQAEIPEGTINRLLSGVSWLRERPPTGRSHLEARVSDADAPPEEMISPEAVFPRRRDE